MVTVDLVLENANIVFPGIGVRRGSIAVKDGKIFAVLEDGQSLDAHRIVDCTDKWVLPGAIDAHTHFGFGTADDFRTETRGAAAGGTTTALSFFRAKDLAEAFPEELARSSQSSYIDFGYHFGITDHRHVDGIDRFVEEFGVSSFKLYLMYKGAAGAAQGFTEIDDGLLFHAMEKVAQLPGALLSVHCENTEVVPYLRQKVMAAGGEGLVAWDEQSPSYLEAENVHRVCYFAKITNCPVNIVHLSSSEALQEVRKHHGEIHPNLHVETCPHYLSLTRDSECAVLGKVGPPLRQSHDVTDLWDGIREGLIDTIGSDHVARKRSTKETSIWDASMGLPGTGLILPILIHEGFHQRGIPIETIAAITSSNVAKLYNIADKGEITPGFDADLVVIDPELERTIAPADLHSYADYSPYEGMTTKGWPVMTILRGEVIVDDGEFLGEAGQGSFLSRRPSPATT